MKFYRLSDVPIQSGDQVFKRSPVGAGIAVVAIGTIAIGALWLGVHRVEGNSVPSVIFYLVAATTALFGWFALLSFHASLMTSNWLVRFQGSGVIIHFRSFLNWKIPNDDAQAVGFDYAEIAWAKIVRERCTSPGLGDNRNTQVKWQTFLQLGLRNPDTAALEEHLQREINLKADGVMITHDYPLQVKPGGILELCWKEGIKPSAHKAVECLRQHVKIAENESRKVNLTDKRDSRPGEEDGKILELAQRGDELGAIRLARMAYGYSLRDAREFVAKLKSGP